jgi:hypothetical protein
MTRRSLRLVALVALAVLGLALGVVAVLVVAVPAWDSWRERRRKEVSDAFDDVVRDVYKRSAVFDKAALKARVGEPSRISRPRANGSDECWLYKSYFWDNHICFDSKGRLSSGGGGVPFDDPIEVEFATDLPAFDEGELASLRKIYPRLLPYFENPADFFVERMERQGTGLVLEVASLGKLKDHQVRIDGKAGSGKTLLDDRNRPWRFTVNDRLEVTRCMTNFGLPCPRSWP